ncbi:MAG TPA: DUF1326 domain-containing protein [Vicinamibacterales bacterium]|nr:DUF1326 domain-containing protein [Vicinamibacterales bacterium]
MVLTGNVVIACNCDWGCPCNFNARPSRGNCEGGWIWMIERGEVNGVSVDGLGVALYAAWPAAIHEGGGRAACYLDERADAAQRAALTSLLAGEAGGPWGLFRKTYELHGPDPARFDVSLARHATRATIGDFVELELTTIRNPVTQADAHPEIVLPEGLVTKHGSAAMSRVFRVRGAVEYDHSGQYAAFGPFSYS